MFSENYSVCLNDDGSARALERNGPVVTYKAIGYDSGRAVAMQLIPLTSIMKWIASDSKRARGRRKSSRTVISPEFLMSASRMITSFS